MSKKVLVLGIIALLAISGIVASNMGFKLNYRLNSSADAGNLSGNNVIALPYNAQTGITTAAALRADIGAASVDNIQRFLEDTDNLQIYTGLRGSPDFPLAPGEAYFIKMSTGVDYIVVGSHDPSLVVSLDGPGAGNLSGNNFYALPYHATVTTAAGLRADIGAASVDNIQRFLPDTDNLQIYTGLRGSPDFPLAPGEGYFIKMNTTVPYTPSHY